jgi:serine/threonine-protein kinase RsbW
MADITLRSDLAELAALAAFIDTFAAEAALPADAAFQLNLVLEELVTNTINYGQAPEAPIRVRLERHGEIVEADLIDGGVAFDPRTLPPPDVEAPLAERPIGGLGIHLVRQFVDELDYRREDGRNHIRLRKRIGNPGAAGGLS